MLGAAAAAPATATVRSCSASPNVKPEPAKHAAARTGTIRRSSIGRGTRGVAGHVVREGAMIAKLPPQNCNECLETSLPPSEFPNRCGPTLALVLLLGQLWQRAHRLCGQIDDHRAPQHGEEPGGNFERPRPEPQARAAGHAHASWLVVFGIGNAGYVAD